MGLQEIVWVIVPGQNAGSIHESTLYRPRFLGHRIEPYAAAAIG